MDTTIYAVIRHHAGYTTSLGGTPSPVDAEALYDQLVADGVPATALEIVPVTLQPALAVA